MKRLLILSTFIALSSCAYKAEIDTRSTMASCVDKGLDQSALIECSSTCLLYTSPSQRARQKSRLACSA